MPDGCRIFCLITNIKTNGQSSSCITDPKDTGGIYNFEKIVISVIYQYPWAHEHTQFPEALKPENLSAQIKKNVEYNFEKILTDDGGKKKPVVILKSRKRGEGWEEIHDKNNLAILVSVNYAPGQNWTPGVEEYGQVIYYVFRKDWDNDAAIIPGPYNSGILTFFPKKDGLEHSLTQFFKQLRPMPVASYDRCKVTR